MRRHGPVIAHCTDSEDFPGHHLNLRNSEIRPVAGAPTGKSSESVQFGMLKACDACADMGQL